MPRHPLKPEVMTPVHELFAAANRLEGLLYDTLGSGDLWRVAEGLPEPGVRTVTGFQIAYGDHEGSLRYIAAMGPVAGAALVKLFRIEAGAAQTLLPEDQADYAGPLLDVARAVLGVQPAAVSGGATHEC